MAAILAITFPHKAAEFWAYQATIVQWVAHDRKFRREALAHRDLNWPVTDTRIYESLTRGKRRVRASITRVLESGQPPPQHWLV
jgi:hypothetical protein